MEAGDVAGDCGSVSSRPERRDGARETVEVYALNKELQV